MPDVDSKLLAALRQTKTTPMFFAFAPKGSSDGKLVVARKQISAKEIAAAKAEVGATLVLKGRCVSEDGTIVFEVAKEPPGTLAKQLKTVIARDAGLKSPVVVRVKADLELESNEEQSSAETDEVPPAPPIPAPPPAPPVAPPVDEAGRYKKRLTALAALLEKVPPPLAGKLVPPKERISQANAAFQNKAYPQAHKMLDQAEALLKEALRAPPPPALPKAPPPPQAPPPKAPPPKAPTDPLEAEWERRVIAVEPRVLDAQKKRAGEAKWMILFMSVQDLGSEGNFAKALEVLGKLENLLDAPPPAPADSPADKSFVAMQAARLRWDETRKKVHAELVRLEKAMRDQCAAYNASAGMAPQVDLADLRTKSQKLYTILEQLDERLIDVLDEALNAKTKELRQEKHTVAVTILQEYQGIVNSDPFLAVIDNNGFAATNVKQTFAAVLADLSRTL